MDFVDLREKKKLSTVCKDVNSRYFYYTTVTNFVHISFQVLKTDHGKTLR